MRVNAKVRSKHLKYSSSRPARAAAAAILSTSRRYSRERVSAGANSCASPAVDSPHSGYPITALAPAPARRSGRPTLRRGTPQVLQDSVKVAVNRIGEELFKLFTLAGGRFEA